MFLLKANERLEFISRVAVSSTGEKSAYQKLMKISKDLQS